LLFTLTAVVGVVTNNYFQEIVLPLLCLK